MDLEMICVVIAETVPLLATLFSLVYGLKHFFKKGKPLFLLFLSKKTAFFVVEINRETAVFFVDFNGKICKNVKESRSVFMVL